MSGCFLDKVLIVPSSGCYLKDDYFILREDRIYLGRVTLMLTAGTSSKTGEASKPASKTKHLSSRYMSSLAMILTIRQFLAA